MVSGCQARRGVVGLLRLGATPKKRLSDWSSGPTFGVTISGPAPHVSGSKGSTSMLFESAGSREQGVMRLS
jgi:hypothetical protein